MVGFGLLGFNASVHGREDEGKLLPESCVAEDDPLNNTQCI